MVHAFVLLKTAAGSSPAIVEELRDLPAVHVAHVVAGPYDVIAELEAEEVYELLELVSNTIRPMEGVLDSKTYVALE